MEKRNRYIGFVSNVLRDVYTSSPRIMLLHVTYEDGTDFRSHVWVRYTDKMERNGYRSKSTKHKIKISFSAKEKKYRTASGGENIGLVSLRDFNKI